METLAPIIVIALLGAVVVLVGWPLRGSHEEAVDEAERNELADLLAAKEAKYREIRDLELDERTGKLSREDFRQQDRARRAEAVEILRRLDAIGFGSPGAPTLEPPRSSEAPAAPEDGTPDDDPELPSEATWAPPSRSSR